MKTLNILLAVALIVAATTIPAFAFNSLDLSTERGWGDSVRGYFGEGVVVTQPPANALELSTERGITGNEIRGYFGNHNDMTTPDVGESIRQSKENG